MSHSNTRENILEKSFPIILKKGFQSTGLLEILNAAGIPKGSFYHYFCNKEEFGLELIDYFVRTQWDNLYKNLRSGSEPPLIRLKKYFDESLKLFQSMNYEGGCPIGNLAQEMCSTNGAFRNKIESAYKYAIGLFKNILDEAVTNGDLAPHFDTTGWAVFLFNSWEGSIIHMKVSKSADPLSIFNSIIFSHLTGVKTDDIAR